QDQSLRSLAADLVPKQWRRASSCLSSRSFRAIIGRRVAALQSQARRAGLEQVAVARLARYRAVARVAADPVLPEAPGFQIHSKPSFGASVNTHGPVESQIHPESRAFLW
ncbi:MAG: hypothetical protein AAFX00_14450, partial [Pseudomonadota bacterium]